MKGVTIHGGEEYSIEDLKNALVDDFKKGTSKIPPIKIVPLLTFYKNTEEGDNLNEDLIEVSGKLYMKTGVYTSLDNRRLTALKMAIAEMPRKDREEFTSWVEVLDPLQPADGIYKAFGSDSMNPMPYGTNLYMIRDRVNMRSNTNSTVHTSDCYFDHKGSPIDPYWGFPNLPKILE